VAESYSRRRTKQFGGGENLPECSKQNIFKCILCSPKKRSSLKFSLKTFVKKGDKLKTFYSSTIGVGKITRGRGGGSMGRGPAAGGQLGSGDGTSRAWRIFTNFFKKEGILSKFFQKRRNFKLIYIFA